MHHLVCLMTRYREAALLALGWLLLAVIVGVAAWVGFNQ
jgi:hypothetical protein